MISTGAGRTLSVAASKVGPGLILDAGSAADLNPAEGGGVDAGFEVAMLGVSWL